MKGLISLIFILFYSCQSFSANQQRKRQIEPYLDGKIVCIIQETDGKSSGVGTPLSSMQFIINTRDVSPIKSSLKTFRTSDGSTPLPDGMELTWQKKSEKKFVSQNHHTLNLDFKGFLWLGENTRLSNGESISVQTYYYTQSAVFNNNRLDLRCRFDIAL